MVRTVKSTPVAVGAAADILLVCDSDSNIAFCTKYAAFARSRGVTATVAFCAADMGLVRQAAHARTAAADGDLKIMSDWRRLFESPDILRHDAIFVMISGKDIPKFCDSLRKASITYGLPRPKTVGGFIGEWISAEPQVTERTGLDLFIVNRADELTLFKTIASKFSFGCEFMHIPYPFVNRHDWARPLPQKFSYRPDGPILYAEQVQVPRTPDERRLLFRTLAELARRHPNRDILFCEREIPMGGTRHRGIGGIDEFFDDLSALAPNLVRMPGGFRTALAEAEMVMSVSSTACIEALLNGVPAVFIKDFTSSGTDKFARTGLTMSLSDIFDPREIEITDSFYAEVGPRDSWDRVLAAATATPLGSAEAGPMLGTLTVQYTPTITVRDALFESAGRILEPTSKLTPQSGHDFTGFGRFIEGLSAGDSAKAQLTDVIRVGSRDPLPVRITADAKGTYHVGESGTDFSLHFDVKRPSIRSASIRGTFRGEPFEIKVEKTKLDLVGVDPTDMLVRWADLGFGSGSRAVMRVRGHGLVEIESVSMAKEKGAKIDGTLIVERSFYPGDVHILMREAAPTDLAVRGGEDLCLFLSPVRRRLFSTQTPLLTVTSKDGEKIELASGFNGSITLKIGKGPGAQKYNFAWAEPNMVVVFATSTLAAVLVNENVVILDRPFQPTRLAIGSTEGEVEACFDAIEAYRGAFAPRMINRLIELITLRLYDGDARATKHTEIPDFRAELEARLGKPVEAEAAPKPAEPPQPAPAAPEAKKGEAKKAEAADAKPAAKKADGGDAKPKVEAAKPKAASASAEAKAAPAAAKAPAPKPAQPAAKPVPAAAKAAEKPNAQAAKVTSLAAPPRAQDPAGFVPPPHVRLTPIQLSEAAFEAADFKAVLKISGEALARTPDSTKHMGMMSKAHEKLNQLEEAMYWAEQAVTFRAIDSNKARVAYLKALLKPAPAG